MTDDIKDIVERLSDGNVELIGVGADHIRLAIIDAKKALTTLSEDNAALRQHLQGMCDYYDNESRSLGTQHFKLHQAAKRHLQAIKDTPNA